MSIRSEPTSIRNSTMALTYLPSIDNSTSNTSLTTFPRSTIHHNNADTFYKNMSNASSTPALHTTLPISGLNSLSLSEDTQATPTPKDKKASSETSLSTMIPPKGNEGGAPLPVDASESSINVDKDQIFVKAHEDDDVFGRHVATSTAQSVDPPLMSTAGMAQNQAQAKIPVQAPFQQTPRTDRMSIPINANNAQGVLPPEACLFIANLATIRDDFELEQACHTHFDLFGSCYIKVRRDKHKHPFALVQYHNVEDSDNAIRASRDVTIDGRAIRVEHAQAHRAVILTRIDGGLVTMEEAQEVLQNYGPVSQMHSTTTAEARELGIPAGMWIQFTYFLDYKDAVKVFNANNAEYQIRVPPGVEARVRSGPTGSPMIKGDRTPRSSTDQKSVFVGNLPPETTEQDLRQIFAQSGIIRAVNVIHKEINGGSGVNTFGFVEFSTASEADFASMMEVEIHGAKIRVEPKEYSARRHVRLTNNHSSAMSPMYHGPRHAYSPQWSNPSPSMYRPNYYPMQSPLQHTGGYNTAQSVHEMSPYHHQGTYSNIYSTPPPSTRMPRRGEMLYTGSPAHMTQFSPFVPSSLYAGNMIQIPEEAEGQHY